MHVRYYCGFAVVVSGLLIASTGQHLFDQNGFYLGAFIAFLGMILLMSGKREDKASQNLRADEDPGKKRKQGDLRRSNEGGGDEIGGHAPSSKDIDDADGDGD